MAGKTNSGAAQPKRAFTSKGAPDGGLFYRRNQGTALVSVKPGVDDGTGKSYDCVPTP